MSINPQTISHLLSLCPICPDIQFKILMLVIGVNGTPSLVAIKGEIDIMKMYYTTNKYPYILEQTLTCFHKDLSLFNYMNCVYPKYPEEEQYDKTSPYLPDFFYEIQIAYDLYYSDDEDDEFINRVKNEYKELKKIKLNKMIEEGKLYNI